MLTSPVLTAGAKQSEHCNRKKNVVNSAVGEWKSGRKDVYLGNDTKRWNPVDANYVSGHAFARVSMFACMPVTSSSASLCTCVHVMV